MHHLADDRPGPDDRHLDDEVVEALGLEARQRRHLRARLHLEDADRVGRLQHPVDLGIVRRQVPQPERLRRRAAGARLISASASCSTAIMPRPSRSILTMPMSAQSSLSHCTTTRPGMLAFSSGTTRVEPPLADHHAARVLPEVPRQVLDALPQLGEQPHARVASASSPTVGEVPRAASRRRRRTRSGASPSRAGRSAPASRPSAFPTSRAALRPR